MPNQTTTAGEFVSDFDLRSELPHYHDPQSLIDWIVGFDPPIDSLSAQQIGKQIEQLNREAELCRARALTLLSYQRLRFPDLVPKDIPF